MRLALEGLAVTPDGSPLRVTLIVPVKPLLAVALTVRFCEAPAVIERLLEESVRVKSGWGLGFSDEGWAPHAINTGKSAQARLQSRSLLNCVEFDIATCLPDVDTMTLATGLEQGGVSG